MVVSASRKGALATLPADCWLLILNHLTTHDLASLARTSRAFRPLVVPLLYQEIIWDWTDPPFSRLLQLLRTVLTRRHLAPFIHHVSFLSKKYPWETPCPDIIWEKESSPYRDVIQLSIRLVKDTSFPNIKLWSSALKRGDHRAYATILLSQLQHLQSLKLDYSLVWPSGFPARMLRHALSPTRPVNALSKFLLLEDVDYGTNVGPSADHFLEMRDQGIEYAAEHNSDQFTVWLRLPSLRRLGIWPRALDGLPEGAEIAPLESLTLARTPLLDCQVQHLLSQMPHLNALTLGLSYYWGERLTLPNAASVLKTIRSLRTRFDNLSLVLEFCPRWEKRPFIRPSDPEWIAGPFRDFQRRFPDLKSIEVPMSMVFGLEARNGRREKLTLAPGPNDEFARDYLGRFEWDDHDFNFLVAAFMAECYVHTLSLYAISVRLWDRGYLGDVRSWDGGLEAQGEEAGSRFRILYDDVRERLFIRERGR